MKRTLLAIAVATLMSPALAWNHGSEATAINNQDIRVGFDTDNRTTNNNDNYNLNKLNVDNRNTNLGVNKNLGINANDNRDYNSNVGINKQGQTLRNSNDLSNRNANFGVNRQGQSLKNKNDLSNRNLGINHQGQSSSNVNLIGPSSQSLGNEIDNSNRNRQKQGQDQAQGQRQGQSMGQSQSQGNKQNTAQSMTYNESEGIHYSGKYKIENTPSMGLGGIDPTVPCAIPLEGTYSGPGIGVGIGSAYVDKNCERRETVRLGFSSGDPQTRTMANQVLQQDLLGYLEQADEVAVERKKEAQRVARKSEPVWNLLDQ